MMNGFQTDGLDMRPHESARTIGKKTANWTVGKSIRVRAPQPAAPSDRAACCSCGAREASCSDPAMARFLSPRSRGTAALVVSAAAMLAVTGGAPGSIRSWSHTGATAPRCFGAASRDPLHPCHNRALRLMVRPSPADALLAPNAPCFPTEHTRLLLVCAFGTPITEATATVALVGDSHASHWRGALDVMARAHRWRAVSLAHTSCPFSDATPSLPEPARSRCVGWNREARAWLVRHPEVSTVFASAHASSAVIPRRGRRAYDEQIAGYIRGWKALPPSVKHVIVIRDVPLSAPGEVDCVQRAIAHRRPAGPTCVVAPGRSLHVDRVQVIDLSSFMCTHRLCFPVVGGALVLKDQSHLTAVFSASLGPYLDRATRRLMKAWGSS